MGIQLVEIDVSDIKKLLSVAIRSQSSNKIMDGTS